MISTLGHLISVDLGTLGVGTSRKTNAFADRSREFLQRLFAWQKMMRAGVLDQTEGSLLRKTLLIVFWMILDDFGCRSYWFTAIEVEDSYFGLWRRLPHLGRQLVESAARGPREVPAMDPAAFVGSSGSALWDFWGPAIHHGTTLVPIQHSKWLYQIWAWKNSVPSAVDCTHFHIFYQWDCFLIATLW